MAQRLVLLTSGGDAPGMNAALRAAARVSTALGWEPVGALDGFEGLIDGRLVPLDLRQLDDAGRRGGTMLGTARSKRFLTEEGRASALSRLTAHHVSAVLVIGGNGSLAGALALAKAAASAGNELHVAGLPASIDNDLAATTLSIGVDTAMNTIVDACDRIADTAAAHGRTFLVEVMGRDCGYLAMTSAIAAGADAVLIPEIGATEEAVVAQVVRAMRAAYGRGTHGRRVLVLKSEGVQVETGRLKELVDAATRDILPGADTRITVLGHVVRGGSPSAFDRLLAARLANAAVRALAAGEDRFMAGWCGPGVTLPACAFDPYVALTPLDFVLAETARLAAGDTPLAKWRRAIFANEIESVLTA